VSGFSDKRKSPLITGLTGQSGAGKTTVSEVFKKSGFAAINCDLIARQAVTPNSECSHELAEKFPEIFDGEVLNRRRAADLLFSDREMLDRYNAVIFPHINALIKSEIGRLADNGYKYILLDAPTLFEAGADKLCDVIVSCIANESVRLKRITVRDGIDEGLAKKRFESQLSEEFFRTHSDYVIENNSDMESAENAARKIAERIIGIALEREN
jgi:dephospho-CoA kinase